MKRMQATRIMFWNADETDASNADNVFGTRMKRMQATRIKKSAFENPRHPRSITFWNEDILEL